MRKTFLANFISLGSPRAASIDSPPHAGSPLSRAPFRVHAPLFVVATLFSLNYIVSKVTMGTITPLTFAYLRIVGAAIVLNALPHAREQLAKGDSRQLVLYAILAVAINQTFFLGGLSLTSAHVAAILITTVPVFTLAAA